LTDDECRAAGLCTDDEYRAKLSGAAINDLPDEAFAYIEPGGDKDEDGKTTPRSKRHFPIHDAPHAKNALARLSSSPFGDKAAGKVKAACKKFGIEVGDDAQNNSALAIAEMRQSESYQDTRDLLAAAVNDKFAGPAGSYTYVKDFTDEWVVYETNNEAFQADYTVDGNVVSLGDPVAVAEAHTYTPIETKSQTRAAVTPLKSDDEKGKVNCDTCGGSGKIMSGKRDCPDCDGSGKIAKSEKKSARSGHRQRRDLPRGNERRAFAAVFELRGEGEIVDNKVTLHGIPIVYDKRYKVVDQFGEFRENMHAGVVSKLLPAQDFDCRFLYNHDGMVLSRSLAGTLEFDDQKTGCHVYPTIDLRSPAAMDLYVATDTKAITQMSIGFKCAKGGDAWRRADDGIEERDVYEFSELNDVSAVAYPCSTETSISIARSLLDGASAETRERLRVAYHMAGDLRSDKLTQADGERLMKIFEELYEVEELRDEVIVTPILEATEVPVPEDTERTRQVQLLTQARLRMALPKR
jgi:HK97 family phage prohead protease